MMPIFDDTTIRQARKEHRFDVDFSQAMQKAFLGELKGFILRRSTRLLPFEEVKDRLEIWFVRDLGLQSISIDSIVGSEGRYQNFSKYFLPLREDLRERWKKVAEAHYYRRDLPPVELYKVQDIYFVRDGHHRISVARAKGIKDIEARVYEYECDVPLGDGINIEKLAIQETYHQFLKDTQLSKNRSLLSLQLTLLGGYPILMEHIQVHKYYLEKEKGEDISIPEASCSWYDNVYMPLVAVIRKSRIMKQFPHRTETDFYLWMIQHRRQLIDDQEWKLEPEIIVEAYTRKYGGLSRKILGVFRRFFRLVRY
ncbi:MAG: hypothetical protein ACQEQO_03400 [Thermodesulfobacteriota bacterium]